MTTRDGLNRTRRRGFLAVLLGFALFALGGAQAQARPAFIGVLFFGFALFAGSIVYLTFSGRCVRCRRLLGRIFSQAGGSPWGIASDLQYCPYCGASLDEDDSRP